MSSPLPPVSRCAACGRLLTDPESIERGYGPWCWKQADLFPSWAPPAAQHVEEQRQSLPAQSPKGAQP